MVSGYALRNGQNGADNLTVTGRTTIPAWAQRLYNASATVQSGPAVSGSYPLGRYMEDNAFLGDLTNPGTGAPWVQGAGGYDLDEFNGRYCVTPEYPNGTYAYFVAISASGAPVFPYNIGRAYLRTPHGQFRERHQRNCHHPLQRRRLLSGGRKSPFCKLVERGRDPHLEQR